MWIKRWCLPTHICKKFKKYIKKQNVLSSMGRLHMNIPCSFIHEPKQAHVNHMLFKGLYGMCLTCGLAWSSCHKQETISKFQILLFNAVLLAQASASTFPWKTVLFKVTFFKGGRGGGGGGGGTKSSRFSQMQKKRNIKHPRKIVIAKVKEEEFIILCSRNALPTSVFVVSSYLQAHNRRRTYRKFWPMYIV